MIFERTIRSLAGLIVTLLALVLTNQPVLGQDKPPEPTPTARRTITISEAVAIFLQQNLELVAARYDIDTAEAEKLTARLRPNPQLNVGLSDLPLNLRGPLIKEQTYDYGVSQTIELIINAVFLPVFTLQGVEGKLFKPLAYAVTFSMIGSMLMALCIILIASQRRGKASPHIRRQNRSKYF
jgi:AcrB/AcrD/AcrF family